MSKSPRTLFLFSGVAAFSAAGCWLLQLPPADTSRWSEKMWAVHGANHATEGCCMLGFALLAILFFVIAAYRWLKSKKQ